MDRARGCLAINAVHAEPDAPLASETGEALAGAIAELATFLGAKEITYTERVPRGPEYTSSSREDRALQCYISVATKPAPAC